MRVDKGGGIEINGGGENEGMVMEKKGKGKEKTRGRDKWTMVRQ